MSTTSSDSDAVGTTTGKDELDKWNWGAFFWTWIWALGHRLWGQALIGFVVSIFVPIAPNIYFALKGNRLAWQTGIYGAREELRARERRWAWAAAIFYGAIAVIIVLAVVAGVFE